MRNQGKRVSAGSRFITLFLTLVLKTRTADLSLSSFVYFLLWSSGFVIQTMLEKVRDEKKKRSAAVLNLTRLITTLTKTKEKREIVFVIQS